MFRSWFAWQQTLKQRPVLAASSAGPRPGRDTPNVVASFSPGPNHEGPSKNKFGPFTEAAPSPALSSPHASDAGESNAITAKTAS